MIATVGPVTLAVVSAAPGAGGRRPRHPGRLAAPRVGLAVATNVLVGLREIRAGGPARIAPGRSPPGRDALLDLLRRAVVRRLRAPADPDRVAALAALALVGQGGRAAPVLTVLGFAVQPDPLAPEYLGNPLAVPALAPALLVAALAGIAVTMAGLLVGAGSLVLRFRRARGVERLQLRWLALAAACASALLMVGLVALFLADDCWRPCQSVWHAAAGHRGGDLRYRLYDLDRIIAARPTGC